MLDDGSAGLFAIAAAGGKTLVRDPYSAVAPDMPRNALLETRADYVLPPAEIASKLVELAAAGVPAKVGAEIVDGMELSEFSCPECHGVLSAMGPPLRFRCRTGHTYGLASLSQEYSDGVKRALWTALRALREKASLARRIAEHASDARRTEYIDQG